MIQKRNVRENVLVTGGAGYIGSTLIRDLLSKDYQVRCLDLLLYGGNSLKGHINHPNFEFIKGDIRNGDTLNKALKNIDSVVHLAAIVGDLPCKAAPKSAIEINFKGTKALAEMAKKNGVKRFIFSSTCSNYGIVESNELADENTALSPVSLYAETKVDCERYLTSISDKDFLTTCLRFGTAYGVSSRTRFDLLVNSFAYEAWAKNEIIAFAANTWRPYIHVGDMALVIINILEAPAEKVGGEIFNAGSTANNYIKKDVVEILKKMRPHLKTKYIDSVDDRRNYRVNCDKLEKAVGFVPLRSVEDGFKELMYCFEHGLLTENDFESNKLESLEKFFGSRESELTHNVF